MKLQLLFSCLFLVLLHGVATRRLRVRERNSVPQPEGECDMVQPFDHDFIYNYNYEAYTEHKDIDNMLGKNLRIKCAVTITIPRRCSGKMRVNGCTVAEGTGREGEEVSYRELPESGAFEREMSVSEMAFHFNGGQITKIFVDKLERTNITNFKRGILSALQAYNSELPREFEVGEVFEIPQETVYGRGVVRQKILEKETGLPSRVAIERDTANIMLPWERRQWNFIRMRNNAKHPLVAAFKDYVTVISEETWSRVKQNCIYTLSRGRQVESASCEEKYPMKPSIPYVTEKAMGGVIETTIRQEIVLHDSRRMSSEDKSTWDVERFDEDNIMFEEEWEETNEAYARGFEAETVFLNLIREPITAKSPALVSKLSRWMAISSKGAIEGVWEKCERECSPEEKPKGRILWAELLNSCINNDWCEIPYCSSANSTTCEDALETFVRSAGDADEEVKEACLVALESVDAPAEKLVDATLKICRAEEQNTARCVSTLGVVTRNFLESCEEECESRKPVANAKNFIAKQLKRACASRSEEAEKVMIAATECIGRLGRNGSYAADAVLECGINTEAPAIVAVKALMAYRNITEKTLPNEAQTKLIALFKNPACSFEARVTCFHVLMTKEIPAAEVEEILKTAIEGEDSALAMHVKEDLRTQLLVRGTEFCGLNPEVAEHCIECIVRNRWDIGVPTATLQKRPIEKGFETTRKINIPYFNTTTDCTVSVKTVHEAEGSTLPIIAKLSVYAIIEGRNISLLEAALDVAGIKPILERIVGRNAFYSEIFDKLLKMPINELHGYAKEYPGLNGLREEGWYTHLLNVFEPNSPLYLKVLGFDIGLNSLLSIESIRQMTIGNLWKILDALEEGFEHEIVAAGQPLIMQHAAPTCIGAPIITSVDVSYIFKNKLNLKADLRKIIFSNSEEATLNLTPEIFVSTEISRTVLTQFCASCGTEMKLEMGHGSSLACEAERGPKGLNIACTPKPGKSTVFYLAGKRSLLGEAGAEPKPTECGEYNFEGLCSVQACYQPAGEPGFAYEVSVNNEMDTEYRAALAWEAKTAESGKYMKELVAECTAESSSSPEARKVLWKSIVSFVPSENEVRCHVDCYGLKWYAASNLMLMRKPGTPNVEGCFASLNASGINNLGLKYNNTFMILPVSENEYKIEADCGWREGESSGGHLLTGRCTETAEGGNLTRRAEVKLVNKDEPNNDLLGMVASIKKVGAEHEIMPGYESMVSVEGPALPYYKKLEFGMYTLNNEASYDKVMMVSGHFGEDESKSHFFVHRIKGTWRGREAPEYNAEIYCVCNLFRAEYVAACEGENHVTGRWRLDVPEGRISYNEIRVGENLLKYNTNKYTHDEAHYVEASYTKNGEETGDVNHHMKLGYRTWDRLAQAYYYEEGNAKYTNHAECQLCHSLKIQHPKAEIESIHRNRGEPRRYEETKWFKLHHSLLRYISIRPEVTYFIINHLKNDYLTLGYRAEDGRTEDGSNRLHVSGELFENIANATLEYDNDMWKFECALECPVLPLSCNASIAMTAPERNAVNINASFEYGEMACDLNGIVTYHANSQVKAYLNATYAMRPGEEYDSICDINVFERGGEMKMTGEYKNIRKADGKLRKWSCAGTVGNDDDSRRPRRNFQLDVFCPEASEEPCTTVTVNKGEKWIKYINKVDDETYDRAYVTVEDDTYTLDAKLSNEVIWDVSSFILTLEMGRDAYGVGIESRICNMSYRHSKDGGLIARGKFGTKWVDYEMKVDADSENLGYAMRYNTARIGGLRVESNFSMAYAFLNFNKALDANVFLGTKPGSFGCGIKLPDMECMIDISAEDRSPEERGFRYICNAQVLPDKIVIKNLTVPIMGAEMEVLDTSMGCEFADGSLEGVYIKDLDLKWKHYCSAEEPTVVKGECAISPEKIIVDIADASRSVFVADAKLEPETPKKSINFVITMPFMKADIGWEFENEANKIAMATKCELCSLNIGTETMTPFLTITSGHSIEETPEGANFPIMNMEFELVHTIWVPFVPSKIEASTKTTRAGAVTTLTHECMLDEKKVSGMTAEIDGCHKRIELIPRYGVCIPNKITARMELDSPMMKCKDSMEISKEGGDWDIAYAAEWTMPYRFRAPKVCSVKCKVEAGACEPSEEFCIPKRLAIKNFDAEIPGEILSALIPSHLWLLPITFEEVRLENCELQYTREVENEVSNNKAILVLRGPSLAEPITVGLTVALGPNHIQCGMMKGEDMLSDFTFTWNAETSTCEIKHEMRSPWLESTVEIATSNIIMVEKCDMAMKTKGMFEEVLPFNMNLKTGEAGWEGKCTCKIGRYDIVLDKAEEGIEISFNDEKSEHVSQTIKITPKPGAAGYDAVLDNKCFRWVTTIREVDGMMKPDALDFHFKAENYGVKIAYENEGRGHVCRFEVYGVAGGNFVCLTSPPMTSETSEATMHCQTTEGSRPLSRIPVTMEDFPFMGAAILRPSIVFIRRFSNFLMNAGNRDEESLETYLREDLYCDDKEACAAVAKAIKVVALRQEKVLREIMGSYIYYFTDPVVAAYALRNALEYIPGETSLRWDWNPATTMGDNTMKVFHWEYDPYFEYKAEVTHSEEGKVELIINLTSRKFTWLESEVMISIAEGGTNVLNMTYIGLGTWQNMLMAVEGIDIVPLEFTYLVEKSGKGFGVECNRTLTSEGRHNFTFFLVSGDRIEYICDVMSPPESWNEAKVECYAGRRENPVGELSLPEVPSFNEYDYTKLDRVLSEVGKVKSKDEREKIMNKLEECGEGAIETFYEYFEPPRSYELGLKLIQYATAVTMHEWVKHIDTEEPYRIAKKFITDTCKLEPNFGETYNDISEYVYGFDWASNVATVVENLIRPILNAAGYALEGHVAVTHETRENEIVFTANILSYRYPLCNCATVLNVKKHEWNKLTINATNSNKLVRMSADILLEGPKVFVEKIFFGLPEEEEAREFLEIRFVPKETEMYEIELYFADSEGGRYGCKGGRPNVETPIMHFHCFKLEGEEIPANPPASSMVAYWDVDIEGVPNAGRSGIGGTIRTLLTLIRNIKACYDEPEVVEEILMKVYHVHDEAVRSKLAKTIVATCRRWVNEIAGPEEEPANRNSDEGGWRMRGPQEGTPSSYGRDGRTLRHNWGEEGENEEDVPESEEGKISYIITKNLKSLSYKMMVSNLKKEVMYPNDEPSEAPAIEMIDLGLVVDATSAVYAICYPIVYYVANVVEFAGTSGIFNASRCTSCEDEPAGAKIAIGMESVTFPILNHETITKISPSGLVNSSTENNCAWGWVECEISAFIPIPRKAEFGLANSREGIKIVFAPEDVSVDSPVMSIYFDTSARHRCDARFVTIFSSSLTCHAYEGGAKGEEEATCDINIARACMNSAGLIYEAATNSKIQTRSISRIIDNACEIKKPALREEVATALSSRIEFIAGYYREEFFNTIKACGRLANLSYSYVTNMIIDMYSLGSDLVKTGKSISPGKYFRDVKNAFEVALGWCEAWTENIYVSIKGLYEAGYALNEIMFDLPTLFRAASESPAIIPKYYHAFYDYMSYMVKGAITPENCVCGMVTTAEGEQAITFNNYVYNFPRKLNKCPYLLAGDISKDSAFTVVLMKGDIVINLPQRSITIDPEMRLYEAHKGESKREIPVPHYDEHLSCTRDAYALTCSWPHINVVVMSENNRRAAFFIEVAEPKCTVTRGLLGVGGNRTEIPEWFLINGTAASSFEGFIDEYSIERECKIGNVPERPQIAPTPKCAAIFESEEMQHACPERRRSFFEACKTGAAEPEEACRYAVLHNKMCEIEGCPVRFYPECDICHGEKTINSELKGAQVVVIISLNRKTKINKVDEILAAIREMANRENKVYNVSIVTFGGREEMCNPHFHTINGMLEIPPTVEWALPRLELNGPEPTPEELTKCVEFAYANTRRAAEGAAKVFFFVVPENMEFGPLEGNEKMREMTKDFVKSYLYIPKKCGRKGAKGMAIGVRPLFIEEEEICERTPAELAGAIACRELDAPITCTCEVVNAYTGEVNDSCRHE